MVCVVEAPEPGEHLREVALLNRRPMLIRHRSPPHDLQVRVRWIGHSGQPSVRHHWDTKGTKPSGTTQVRRSLESVVASGVTARSQGHVRTSAWVLVR